MDPILLIHLSLTWIVSTFCVLWIMMLWTFLHRFVCGYFSRRRFPGSYSNTAKLFVVLPDSLPKQLHHFTFLSAVCEGSNFPYPFPLCPTISYSCLSFFSFFLSFFFHFWPHWQHTDVPRLGSEPHLWPQLQQHQTLNPVKGAEDLTSHATEICQLLNQLRHSRKFLPVFLIIALPVGVKVFPCGFDLHFPDGS